MRRQGSEGERAECVTTCQALGIGGKQIKVISHVSDHCPSQGKLACLGTMDIETYRLHTNIYPEMILQIKNFHSKFRWVDKNECNKL